jgi:hypothetical protein
MLTRRLLAFPIAIGASLVLATAVLAGGWASVAISDPPADPTAGGETVIDLTVLQHGVTPIDWIGLTVVATNAATGETVSAVAKPVRQGQYRATLTFPSAGDWSLAFASSDLVMEGNGSLAVAVGAPVAATGGASDAAASAPMIALGLLVIAFLATFAIMVIRDRRRDRTVVTAG